MTSRNYTTDDDVNDDLDGDIARPAGSRFAQAFSPVQTPSDTSAADAAISGDLRTELEILPQMIVTHGRAYARAMRDLLRAKAAAEEIEQAEYLTTRERAAFAGDKVTEATLNARVSKLERVRAARAAIIEAEYEKECARAVCDALRAKREALSSLVQLARAEMAAHGAGAPRASEDKW